MGKRYRAKKDPDPLAPGWYDARFVKHTEDEGDYGPFIEYTLSLHDALPIYRKSVV